MDMKKLKVNYTWILFGVLVSLFLIWTILVLNGNLLSFDYKVFDFIHHYLLSDFLTFFLKIITYMGSAWFLGLITLIILCFFKNKLIGICLGINLFLVSMLNLILKNIFLIPRPDTLNLILENGFSYPSGHAMTSFAFYGFIIYLVYKKMKPSVLKKGLILLFILLILFIGFSRIYLGVHHFSDILGGYFISFAYLLLFVKLSRKLGMEKYYEVQERN